MVNRLVLYVLFFTTAVWPRISMAQDMNSEEPSIWLGIIISLIWMFLFVGMVSVILIFTAHVSGWKKLSNNFATETKRPKNSVLTTVVFRWIVGYEKVVFAGGTQEGLHLSILSIMSLGHSNLLIPWNMFAPVQRKKILFLRYISTSVEGIPISLPEKTWDLFLSFHN